MRSHSPSSLRRILAVLGLVALVALPGQAVAATPAEQLIASTFPYIAQEGHAPVLPSGVQTAADQPGRRYLKFQDGGETVHAFAVGPFAFERADGEVRSIDTDLVPAAGGGWQPVSVPFSVTLPALLETGVIWQDAGTGTHVRIYPQNIHGAPGHVMAGTADTVLYEDTWNHTHMTLAVTAEGIKDHIIVTQANGAPSHFKFRVERPAGATTSVSADGGVRVADAAGTTLAALPTPVGRDRDHQEFRVWYEVVQHANFDVIELHYDTSPQTAEGVTTTYEAPFDLDPAIYSGSIIHGVNAFRETSLNAYTVSDIINGNLRVNLLQPDANPPAVPTYPAGKFARWWITPPPAGSRWHNFSARIEGRVGVTQRYTLHDDAGTRYTFGPAAAAGTYFAQNVSFTPAGDLNSRIEATASSTPLYDYYGILTNAVALYEDLVDPELTDLRPSGITVTTDEVTVRVGMRDNQSGCGTITVTLHGPVAPIGTRTGTGCTFAPNFTLRTEGTHRIDVVLTDKSDRQTSATGTFEFDSPVDPPQPPVIDGDDPTLDRDWTNQTSAFSARWKAATGAISYQLCFTTTACAPNDRWTGFSATAGTVGGYSFQHGETVFACVRSITSDGVRTTPTCSDGQRVDLVAPSAPGIVRDGASAGTDADFSSSSLHAASNWNSAVDDSGQLLIYDTCYRLAAGTCTSGHWGRLEEPGQTREHASLQMGPGERRYSCVRASDPAGNLSASSCSDGFVVRVADSEIDAAVQDRATSGLPADPDMVEARLQAGAYNEQWIEDGTAVTQAELPAYMAHLQVQTWLIDHDALMERVTDGNDIQLRYDTPQRKLIVVVPKRACSPRVELRRAFGSRVFKAVSIAVRQKPYTPMATSRIRTLIRSQLMANASFESLDVRGIAISRRGVSQQCLVDMEEWLSRPAVRSRLTAKGYPYTGVMRTFGGSSVTIFSDSDPPLYKAGARGKTRLVQAKPEPSVAYSSHECPDSWYLSRNTYYCREHNVVSGTTYHSSTPPSMVDRGGEYGGCTYGFAVRKPSSNERFMLTARHCHETNIDEDTNRRTILEDWAKTSWHRNLNRYAEMVFEVGKSRPNLESSTVDLTALSTVNSRGGAYVVPTADNRNTPRTIAVDFDNGVVRNSPRVPLNPLKMRSSRPSAEGSTHPQPNGIAHGSFAANSRHNFNFDDEGRFSFVTSYVARMWTCKGDSGSGVFVKVWVNGRAKFRPFGVTSQQWHPDGIVYPPGPGWPTENLYHWNSRWYPVPDAQPDLYKTQCGMSALVAPAWGYVRDHGMVPVS